MMTPQDQKYVNDFIRECQRVPPRDWDSLARLQQKAEIADLPLDMRFPVSVAINELRERLARTV